MARFNEIFVGRYNRFLQKFLGMKGMPPSPQLASELMGVWALFHGVENRYLEGWDKFAFRIGQAGVAAQQTSIRMRNPAGSNVVAVIEQMYVVDGAAADTIFVDRGGGPSVDLTVISPTLTREDPRGRSNPTCVFSQNDAVNATVAANPFAARNWVNTNQDSPWIYTENQQILILPGDMVQVRTNGLANALNWSVWWRERFLEDSERA